MDMDNRLVKAKGMEAGVEGGGERRRKGEYVQLCQHSIFYKNKNYFYIHAQVSLVILGRQWPMGGYETF